MTSLRDIMLHRVGLDLLLASLTLILLLIACQNNNCVNCIDTNTKEPAFEPPFPHIFNTEQLQDRRQLHILSESFSDELGYETIEEYVDFDLGKSTLIVNSKNGHRTTHVDSVAGLIFRYKPYICLALKPIEVGYEDGLGGIWSAAVALEAGNSKKRSEKVMNVYGVSALWFNVGQAPKAYSSADWVYSASKDLHRQAHKWTINYEKDNNLVHMHFIETNLASSETKFSLEMIQIESIESKKITQTVNILSLSESLSSEDEAYANQLQVPVGYGCMSGEATEKAKIEFPQIDKLYFGPLMQSAHRLEIEATATKYLTDVSGGKGRISDTISAEIIRTNVTESNANGAIQLVRQRSTKADIKTIAYYPFNVQYKIDLRKGTCDISNMGRLVGDSGERIALYFSNGLVLVMGERILRETFVNTEGFYFIKRVSEGVIREYFYFEKSGFWNNTMRVIRTYSRKFPTAPIVLESVSIWTFDDKYTRILESYHLNVINAESIESSVEMAKLFDVSEDCYLNNDNMKSGRDFAWIELSYYISNIFNGVMSANSAKIKEKAYFMLEAGNINFFRAPRMELMFEDTGFILRILLLDRPALPLIYDLKPNYQLQPDKETGDLSELAVDVNHCADLCRLNKCKTMSYCEQGHVCLLSVEWPGNEKCSTKLVRNQLCKTYVLPRNNQGEQLDIRRSSLHSIVSMLRHQNYDPVALPKLPDELAYPRSETGVDDETYSSIAMEYLKELNKFTEGGSKLPLLTFPLSIDGVYRIMLANKFELEQDPLDEFYLVDKISTLGEDSSDDFDEQLSSSTPTFHEGLSMQAYKMSSFNGQSDGRRRARLLSGLNYDQCALACVDSNCNSFSYCTLSQECIITDIYDIGNITQSLIDFNVDCFIAQRDYLSKFNKFKGVFLSSIYEGMRKVYNAAECAHACVLGQKECLAFDYCEAPPGTSDEPAKKQLASCYFLRDRFIYTGANRSNTNSKDGKKPSSEGKVGGRCDHYSRSYLADFVRIEYREIEKAALAELKTISFDGRSVDQCADLCATEIIDCTAFQFCFDAQSSFAMQRCVLIEGRPQSANASDYKVLLKQTSNGQQVVEVGKIFKPSEDCHVFSLKRTSSEARLRDLALKTSESGEEQDKSQDNDGGLSLGGCVLLYICLSMVFAAIGCGVCLAKHNNDYVRQKIERIQHLIRF